MTLGAIPIGTSAVASASATDSHPNNKHTKRVDKQGSVKIEEIQGQKRSQLIQAANTSDKVNFVTDHLGKHSDVTTVYKFTLQNGTTGFGVNYGTEDRSEGQTIRYYESDLYNDGTLAAGGKPAGDGIIGVRSDSKTITHIHGTPRQKTTMSVIQNNDEYKAFKRKLDGTTLLEEEAIIAHDLSGKEGQTDISIPIGKDKEMTDRLVLTGPKWPTSSNVQKYSINRSTDNPGNIEPRASPQCAAICTALTAAGAFGCAGACATNPVTAPVASYCGQLCAAVAIGKCPSTCNDLIG